MQSNLTLIIIAALMLLNGCASGYIGAPAFYVAVDGSANATIVKPASATVRESFAAGELQRYIEKISGATLPIASDGQAVQGNRILIGGPERNSQTAPLMSESEFDVSVPGPEGMMLKTLDSRTLLLAGSSKDPDEFERGTIYAVYEFLERPGMQFCRDRKTRCGYG